MTSLEQTIKFTKLERVQSRNVYSNMHGFTLFELLIAISILAITAAIALPNYTELNASIERMNVRQLLLQDLRRAQAESVTHGCRGIFKIAANNRSYNFGCDYLNYDTSSPPSADSTIFARNLPIYFYAASDMTVIFNSKGQIVDEFGFLDSRQITLSENSSGSLVDFATGNILGTGVFEYD